MRREIALAVLGMLIAAATAWGQSVYQQAQPAQGQPAGQAVAQPDQPVVPQTPVLQAVQPQQVPAGQSPQQGPQPADAQQAQQGQPQGPPKPPFTLTKEEEGQLDAALQAWQQHSDRVKSFRASFVRFDYDLVFGPADKPRSIDRGAIAFGAPDKGMFSVEKPHEEYWICDGKSIFEYDYGKQRVTEYKLPPELQGKQITNGPLPFLFGAPASQLRHRYYLRLFTPPNLVGKEIWLQAVPRFQQDAANFRCAELILAADTMMPLALQIHQPGGKNRAAYKFENVIVNDPLGWLKGDPFRAITPFGWTRVVEDAPKVGAREPGASIRQ
jgi:TIGR03009 family protein